MKVTALLATCAFWVPHVVAAQSADSVGHVLGHVYSVETGKAIEGAEITLPSLGISVLSDRQGHFVLKNLPAGANLARINHLGHRTIEWILNLEAGRAHQLEVRMYVDAILMEPIRVEVKSGRWMDNIEGLRHRMRKGFGEYMTRREIEQEPSGSTVTQLLRGMPGIRVNQTEFGSTLSFRGGTSVGGFCVPALYVDGREWQITDLSGLDVFQASDLEAIEVYKSSITAPIQYRGGLCGTLLIWTRLGGRPKPSGGQPRLPFPPASPQTDKNALMNV